MSKQFIFDMSLSYSFRDNVVVRPLAHQLPTLTQGSIAL